MTKLPVLATALVAALAIPTAALAVESDSSTIDGAYLLRQSDEHQRVLTFESGGTVSQISDQQNAVGYTSGLGSWTKTGPGSVTASIVDFNQPDPVDSGHGPSMIVFDLTFSNPVDGSYQYVSGTFSGEAFATGQDPLKPSEAPVRSFGTNFEGTRIVAE
ncbi:hypothetical protein [Nitratireductor sp. XY-223]|uniref:hypothetical protein n=1 Tax=Nitratireductor sp. XY-223 TaxID=2561926 RepID=UPI0010AA9492|nr:hypothetical protein [Nitratireductor sp. XY-223]